MGNVISISLPVDGFITRCFDYSARQVELGRNLEENVKTLVIEWDELWRMKIDVQDRINHEEGPQMQRLSQVDGWITWVTDVKMTIDKLIEHSNTEINKQSRCIECCAKSSKTRRSLEERVVRMLQEVADLKSKGEFSSVVHQVAGSPLATRNSEPTVGLEKSIDEVWRYINDDDDVGIIGLYGMGGVGKTTLLTEINNKLSKETHGFNLLIWVPVSNNSNIDTIQYEIGKKLGFNNDLWKNKNRAEKSEDIFSVLTLKKFALLFDDIKVPFDLKDVGVPIPNRQNKSMVIFTTRNLDVCGQMDAQKKVEVKCLGVDEAWELFKSKAGEYVLHPEIIDIAELVAKKCGGLPLALTIIGKMMASKRTPEEWAHVLLMLKENAAKFTGLESKVFSILKVSYDNLPSDIERQCLLYCTLFPEDYYIPKQKLINYWFGERFRVDLCYDFHTAKLEGYSIIGTLINACLLEEDESDGVKMHDVIRSMALWLTSDYGKGTRKYLAQARAGLTEVPQDLHNTDVERIALTGNYIEELPELRRCHSLLTLLLNNNRLNQIPEGFFWSMHGLRVLDLSGNEGISELPTDISLLVSIQYLNLSGTGITSLPKELGRLIRLLYLDLTYTNHLHIIPDGLISSFEFLRVLKMFGCGSSDRFKEMSSFWGLQEYLLRDIQRLHYLSLLCITIRSTDYLIPFLESSGKCITRLGLSHLKLSNILLQQCMTQVVRLERLEITDCEFEERELSVDCCKISQLHSLFIVRCSNFEDVSFGGNTKLLIVAYCKDVLSIVFGTSFPEVEEMYFIELPKLKRCTSYSKICPRLRYIGVEGCPKLRYLGVESTSELTIQGSEDWWNALKRKPDASACITDSKDSKGKNAASSSDPLKFIPHMKGKNVAESSSSTFDPDTYIPYFKSFD